MSKLSGRQEVLVSRLSSEAWQVTNCLWTGGVGDKSKQHSPRVHQIEQAVGGGGGG